MCSIFSHHLPLAEPGLAYCVVCWYDVSIEEIRAANVNVATLI